AFEDDKLIPTCVPGFAPRKLPLNLRAIHMVDVGDRDEVRRALEHKGLKPQGPLSRLETAEHFIARGLDHGEKGDSAAAIADFGRALDLDPKHAGAFYHRGLAHAANGDFDLAIADFDMAIELDPKNNDVYNNRGLAYAAKGDYDRAIAEYSKAIELNAKHAGAYNNRGLA